MFPLCSMTCVLRRRCIPAACGALHWTSWTMWWSAACCLSSVWETGFSSPTWEHAAWTSSTPPSCLSTTLSPPLTGEYGVTVSQQCRCYKNLMHVESNWHQCLVLPTGTKCRRLVWHWTATWRISAWSSTVRNYPLSLSRCILHRSSLASAFTMWEEGSVRYLGQGAKCGQHSSHLGKCSVLFFLPGIWLYFLPLKIGKIGYLIPQLSSKFHLENLHFCSSLRWICQPKELQPKLKWNYATKWTTLWRWDPPQHVCGGLFPYSNPVYKLYNWFKSSLWITCRQLFKSCVCSTPIHFVCRWFLKC